jgi:hypothetical protein
MATQPFFETSVAAFRLSPSLLWHPLRARAAELSRALVAVYRDEQLRISSKSSAPRRDRGSNARPLFTELRGDPLRHGAKSLSEVC